MTSLEPPGLAIVVPSARREGGGDVWLDGLMRHLPGLGIAPLVVFEGDGELVERAVGYGCRAVVAAQPDDAALTAFLVEFFSTHRPMATVFWSPRAQVYGAPAHLAAGSPGRTAWVQHVMPSDFWIHRDASALPADAVVCVSTAVATRQRDLYPGCPTQVVHPGVDRADVLPTAVASAQLGLAGAGPFVGVVGRVEPWKGQDIAVRMLVELRRRGLGARLVLIGEARSRTWPEFGPDVADLADELGVCEYVSFTGALGDVPALLPALDVLVCTSREEGFGLVAVEAMAAGVPVVSTRCGGPEDVVEHEVTGLLAASEDAVGLANQVQRVLSDPSSAAGRVRGAHELWCRSFTARCSAEAFAELVRALAR